MHVLVIGGTGFIGFHVVNQLLQQGHQVSLLCRNLPRGHQLFDERVQLHTGDLNFFHNLDFDQLFRNVDTLIYAAGADERAAPDGDPYTFFYRENVTTCINLLEKARQHQVRQAIVLGSIFTHFNDLHPELNLAGDHPYIHARADQKREALQQSSSDFHVNLLEIPFVFGSTPGCVPIWRNIVNYIRIATPLLVTPGGVNAMSVSTLAQAIYGTTQHVHETGVLPVGDQNLKWSELVLQLNQQIHHKDKLVTQLNTELFSDLTQIGARLQEVLGWQSGLNHRKISNLITLEAFLDTTAIKQQLQYQGGDLHRAFADTVAASPEPAVLNRMNRTISWLSESSRDFVFGLDQSLQKYKRQR